jgi:uncharacterized protein YkwD
MARKRLPLTLAACAACLLGPVAAASACDDASDSPTRATVARARSATLCLINEERSKRGLSRLGSTASLTEAATAHSRSMVDNDFFSHSSPGGRTPRARVAAAGYFDGASSWAIGETIAWGSGGSASPSSIVRSWLRSPGHRAILLDGRFDDAGIGIALGSPGGGGGATFTGDFGKRSS